MIDRFRRRHKFRDGLAAALLAMAGSVFLAGTAGTATFDGTEFSDVEIEEILTTNVLSGDIFAQAAVKTIETFDLAAIRADVHALVAANQTTAQRGIFLTAATNFINNPTQASVWANPGVDHQLLICPQDSFVAACPTVGPERPIVWYAASFFEMAEGVGPMAATTTWTPDDAGLQRNKAEFVISAIKQATAATSS
jgi:hypothetical protein